MGKIKNTIFQWLYFKIFRKMIPCTSATSIEANYNRMMFQYYFANLFGGAKLILAGDSDSAIFDQFSYMKEFHKVVMTWGVGGTTSDSWIDFFNSTVKGRRLLVILLKIQSVWDNGGNYILQNNMGAAQAGITALHNLFPASYACTVPPVEDENLAKIPGAQPAEYYKMNTLVINNIIKSVYPVDRVIDCYEMFVNHATGEAAAPIFFDGLVHYNRFAIKCILRVEEHI